MLPGRLTQGNSKPNHQSVFEGEPRESCGFGGNGGIGGGIQLLWDLLAGFKHFSISGGISREAREGRVRVWRVRRDRPEGGRGAGAGAAAGPARGTSSTIIFLPQPLNAT